jgi:hypothetical protein
VTSAQGQRSPGEQLAGWRIVYDFLPCAVDHQTQVAYAEIHPLRQPATCAAFLRSAAAGPPTTASTRSSG